MVGDFIGCSGMGPYTTVLAVSSTTITVSDPDEIWAKCNLAYGYPQAPYAVFK
jgi:hypothetical protein